MAVEETGVGCVVTRYHPKPREFHSSKELWEYMPQRHPHPPPLLGEGAKVFTPTPTSHWSETTGLVLGRSWPPAGHRESPRSQKSPQAKRRKCWRLGQPAWKWWWSRGCWSGLWSTCFGFAIDISTEVSRRLQSCNSKVGECASTCTGLSSLPFLNRLYTAQWKFSYF